MKHGCVSSTVQGGGKRREPAVFGLITVATSSAFPGTAPYRSADVESRTSWCSGGMSVAD
jgi:hypothetical protein